MLSLEKCIKSLKTAAGKPNKFERLRNKLQDWFSIYFGIDLPNIGKMKAGFDNHHNHQRPHVHIETGVYDVGKISVAIDNGEIVHRTKKKIDSKITKDIKSWVLDRKACLKLIYDNIQNCKNKSDFDPIVDAMDRYL